MLSKADYMNVNLDLALRYLIVTGGKCHIDEIGLKKIAPRWLGTKQDLLSVGGDSIGEDKKWTKIVCGVTEFEKKQIISRVIESAVLGVICTSSNLEAQCG